MPKFLMTLLKEGEIFEDVPVKKCGQSAFVFEGAKKEEGRRRTKEAFHSISIAKKSSSSEKD